jgi:hypothetical protein
MIKTLLAILEITGSYRARLYFSIGYLVRAIEAFPLCFDQPRFNYFEANNSSICRHGEERRGIHRCSGAEAD